MHSYLCASTYTKIWFIIYSNSFYIQSNIQMYTCVKYVSSICVGASLVPIRVFSFKMAFWTVFDTQNFKTILHQRQTQTNIITTQCVNNKNKNVPKALFKWTVISISVFTEVIWSHYKTITFTFFLSLLFFKFLIFKDSIDF